MKRGECKTDINTKQRSGYLQAAFTVEASMLMILILPLLMLIMVLAMDLHDQAVLQGAVSEAVSMGGNLVLYKEERKALSEKIQETADRGTIWAGDISGNVSIDTKHVSASLEGTIDYPGFVQPLREAGPKTITASGERTIIHPPSLIWKVRGVKRVVSALGTF